MQQQMNVLMRAKVVTLKRQEWRACRPFVRCSGLVVAATSSGECERRQPRWLSNPKKLLISAVAKGEQSCTFHNFKYYSARQLKADSVVLH